MPIRKNLLLKNFQNKIRMAKLINHGKKVQFLHHGQKENTQIYLIRKMTLRIKCKMFKLLGISWSAARNKIILSVKHNRKSQV